MDNFQQEEPKDVNKKVTSIAVKAPLPPPPLLLAKKKEVKDEASLAADGGLGRGLVPGIFWLSFCTLIWI